MAIADIVIMTSVWALLGTAQFLKKSERHLLIATLGNAAYGSFQIFLDQQIVHFNFSLSLFDLVLWSVFRGALVGAMFWLFRVHTSRLFPAVGLIVAVGSLGYGAAKCYFSFTTLLVPVSRLTFYLLYPTFFLAGLAYFGMGLKAAINAAMLPPPNYEPLPSLWADADEDVAAPVLMINGDLSDSKEANKGKKNGEKSSGKGSLAELSIGRVASLVIPEIPMLAFAMVMLVISAASLLLIPILFGAIITALDKDLDIMPPIYGLLVAASVGSIAVLLRTSAFKIAGQRVVCRLRIDLFRSILRQDVSFFDNEKIGEITNRISADTEVLQEALTQSISQLLRNAVTVLGALVILFVTSWKLTLVMMAVVPVITVAAVLYGKAIKRWQQQFQNELAESVAIAAESLSAVRTIRTFVRETRLLESFSHAVLESYGWGIKVALGGAIFQAAIFFVSQGAIVLVIWYGSRLIQLKELNVGTLISFMLYSITIGASMAMLSGVFGTIMQGLGASIRVFELLDQKPHIPIEGGLPMMEGDAVLSLENVHFHYPSRPDSDVLKGVSFTLRPNHITALVGKSGSGKSTIVQLLERFYDPTLGRILHNGIDLRDLDPALFRRSIGYVKQEPTLFSASIKENILFGVEDPTIITEEMLHEICRQSNCHDFIMEFEEGYATMVGERGVQLSGGQRSRVAVARALILNPKILLLDEATAALDAESEYLVTQAIERAMQGRTVLVIAHRLSTVKNATEILVMSKGSIVEKGTHDELLSQHGVYAELVKRQLTVLDEGEDGVLEMEANIKR